MCTEQTPDPIALSRAPGLAIADDVDAWVRQIATSAQRYGLAKLPTAWVKMAPSDQIAAAALICVQLRYQADQGDKETIDFFRLFCRWRAPPAPPRLAAGAIAGSGSLAVVTSYYNPAGFKRRRANYEKFAERLRVQGVELFTIEAAFAGDDFDLSPSLPGGIQLRADSVMWQKERLLNILIKQLPARFDKIAWLDNDLIFENDFWAQQAAALLNDFPVIQLFDTVEFIGKDGSPEPWAGGKDRSPGSVAASGTNLSLTHPGFAWAARRDFIACHGLCCDQIAGSGDAVMYLAFTGRLDHNHFHRYSAAMRREFAKWAGPVFDELKGQVSFVPGTIKHLWHGTHSNRQYDSRLDLVKSTGFDPTKHLTTNASGLWEWSDSAPTNLKDEMIAYFAARGEDDSTPGYEPEITCVMVTNGLGASDGWNSFLDQTYQKKHLVMVNCGRETALGSTESEFINEIMVPRGLTTAELRNIGIEAARTVCVAQWDDGENIPHDRLELLAAHWRPYQAVILRSDDGRDLGGDPSTLLFDRRNAGHYPRMTSGEDYTMAERLKRQGILILG